MKKSRALFGVSLASLAAKAAKKGNTFWKVWFVLVLIYRVIRWLLARPTPTVDQQYDLAPGEYTVIVKEKE